MRYFSVLRRYRRLATFRGNNKKLRIRRRLLKLTKSFSDSWKKKRRGVWSSKGNISECRIRNGGREKLRLKRPLRRTPKKLNKPSDNSRITSNKLRNRRRIEIIIY
jgi:hypothetical protein